MDCKSYGYLKRWVTSVVLLTDPVEHFDIVTCCEKVLLENQVVSLGL